MINTEANSLFRFCIEQLSIEEKEAVSYLLLEDAHQISKTDIVLNRAVEIDKILLQKQLDRLNKNEPLQHVVGFTYFRNRKFFVSKDVLIPRPETEEIIDLIKSQEFTNPSVLDIGTGSGCIAISLALELENTKVTALDVSKDALALAKRNATSLAAQLHFIEADILNYGSGNFDIIVSNPPYIRNLEKSEMAENVLNYEPDLALFVEDNDPLIFYQAIAKYGKSHLNANGFIAVEINAYLGAETKALFESYHYKNVSLIQDFYEKDRFVLAKN